LFIFFQIREHSLIRIPSIEIQNWLLKYRELTNNKNLNVKAISGFYVASTDIMVDPFWIEFLQNNVKAEIIYPPILCLKLNKAELAIEEGALELVKDYSNERIEFYLK